MVIDLDGIGQRIVALPIRPANYIELDPGKTGILFLSEIVDVPRFNEPPAVTVSKFDLSTRKTEPYLSGVTQLYFSANGEKALFRQGPPPAGPWFIVEPPGSEARRRRVEPRGNGGVCRSPRGMEPDVPRSVAD